MKKIKLIHIFLLLIIICVVFVGILIFQRSQTVFVQEANPLKILNLPLPDNWKTKVSLPGNSFETSISLTPGYDIQGTLDQGNILDYYFFYVQQPSRVSLTVTNLPSEFAMVFYDSNYQEVGHTLRSGSIGGSTTLSLQPGKYYIKILTNYIQITNNAYTIRLDISPLAE